MKHNIRVLGLSFLAVCLLGAVAAASASASQPKFVLESGTTATFSGAGAGGTLETVGKNTVTCTGASSKGTIASETTVTGVVVKFTGCTASFGAKCTTGKEAAGTIVTNPVGGALHYVKAGSSETAVLLKPESGTVFATFVCAGVSTVTVQGSVDGILTPVNGAFSKTATLTFTQASGVQSPLSVLSASCVAEKDTLETKASGFPSFPLEQSAIKGSETLTTSVGVKVSATSCV